MITHVVILALCLLGDLAFSVRVGGSVISPQLSILFPLYLGFRKSFFEIVVVAFVFMVLSHPFSTLGVRGVFFPYAGVLFLVYQLRSQVFAEAYLTHAAWVMIFSVMLRLALGVQPYGRDVFDVFSKEWPQFVVHSILAGFLTVPLFLWWDSIYEGKKTRSSRQRDDFYF